MRSKSLFVSTYNDPQMAVIHLKSAVWQLPSISTELFNTIHAFFLRDNLARQMDFVLNFHVPREAVTTLYQDLFNERNDSF
jgi:hypothetical protein